MYTGKGGFAWLTCVRGRQVRSAMLLPVGRTVSQARSGPCSKGASPPVTTAGPPVVEFADVAGPAQAAQRSVVTSKNVVFRNVKPPARNLPARLAPGPR